MTEKKLDVTKGADLAESDVVFVGNPDAWQLLLKASSKRQHWMKSTKAMEVPGGCLVQTTSERTYAGQSVSVCDTTTFVPNVRVEKLEGGGTKLVQIKDYAPGRGFASPRILFHLVVVGLLVLCAYLLAASVFQDHRLQVDRAMDVANAAVASSELGQDRSFILVEGALVACSEALDTCASVVIPELRCDEDS